MANQQTYIIRTVEDLLQLDERQLDACLADLKTWVQFRHQFDAQLEQAKKVFLSMTGLPPEGFSDVIQTETQDHMAWVDDGIQGGEVKLNFNVRNPDGTITELGDLNLDLKTTTPTKE